MSVVLNIEEIAARLDQAAQGARLTHQLEAPIPLDTAYEIQAMALRRRTQRGERISGLKMGFTSRAKMAQMGISEMIFGRITEAMAVEEGASVAASRFIHPRVEPEIAFILGRSLAADASLPEARAAVAAVAPAIEIIDSRYADFRFSLPDVVADNASAAGYVLGLPVSPDTDIANLGMALFVDGVAREIGSSAAILGNPWRSLVAAAKFAGRYGFDLRAGDVVLAGGATAAIGVGAGSSIRLETQGMGSVSFTML